MRVYSLWMRKTNVLMVLLAAYVASYASLAVVLTIMVLQLNKELNDKDPGSLLCYTHKVDAMYYVWPFMILFDVAAFTLTLIAALKHPMALRLQTRLLFVLYRDGLGYFVLIILMKTMNLLIWTLAPFSLFALGTFFVWSSVTLLTTRMYLNLRLAVNSEVGPPDTIEPLNIRISEYVSEETTDRDFGSCDTPEHFESKHRASHFRPA